MKTHAVAVAFAVLSASLPLAASAQTTGFTGTFAPGDWTTTVLGTLLGASANPGSTTMTSSTLTILGGDADPAGCSGFAPGDLYGPCEIRITTTNVQNPFSFAWDYGTSDISAGFDPFGVLLDGVRTTLADPGGPLSQSGVETFTVTSSFGWFINCTDCTGGAATVVISQFTAGAAAVPEPGSLVLLAAGLAGWGVAKRRRAA